MRSIYDHGILVALSAILVGIICWAYLFYTPLCLKARTGSDEIIETWLEEEPPSYNQLFLNHQL